MAGSSPTSVSRYRPAVLIIVGAAAAYAAYLAYSTSQAPSSEGLHRSNALRRPNARQRRLAALEERINVLAGEVIEEGQLNYNGVTMPFGFGNLISRTHLHDILVQLHPGFVAEQVEAEIDNIYDVFLTRLFVQIFPRRAPSQDDIAAIAMWIADSHGHNILQPTTAVERAAANHVLAMEETASHIVYDTQSVAATELSWSSDSNTGLRPLDPGGQTLQSTVYHIAEDLARQEGVVHRGITCNSCDEKPIRGIRWHCVNCADFDLCSDCEATDSHPKTHIFYKIRVPIPYRSIAKHEPLYPGKPHMMTGSVPPVLKNRLIAETKMGAEEIDALWEQFTCIAATEWSTDPNNVGWAIDRRAFNQAFVPRHKSFVAAPNLVYDRVFSYYDSDKNSLIGFEEWIKAIDGIHTRNPHVKSKIIFDGYDIDGDGYISRKDILRIFRAYYAIEREAACDYVAEITEDLSVRNALDVIRSAQALGSAFTPHGGAFNLGAHLSLPEKDEDGFTDAEPVLQEDIPDTAERDGVLEMLDPQTVACPDWTPSEHNHVLRNRWARRQFYTDEEEGFILPEGVEDETTSREEDAVDHTIQREDSENISNPSDARPRWSRSSSRVRFQDDGDRERSNASISSHPVGERWGGYEIPEPEKDLGKEVLYQITQQAFNELLDTIFEEEESNAMDAYATRNERRRRVSQLEDIAMRLKGQELGPLSKIYRTGIFWYSECIIDRFCHAINDTSRFEDVKAVFHEFGCDRVDRDTARSRLQRIYSTIESSYLDTVDLPDVKGIDDMALWNTWLCRNRLRDEVLAATLDCASQLGWISYAKPMEPSSQSSTLTSAPPRDPTMPQHRPNSLADITAPDSPSTGCEYARATSESSFLNSEAVKSLRTKNLMTSSPSGPFFVGVLPSVDESDLDPVAQTIREGFTTTASSNASESVQEHWDPYQSDFPLSTHTNDPWMHLFHIDSSDGSHRLCFSPKPIYHSSNPFGPETDESKLLYRRIRELTMITATESRDILLASLEAVQQQIYERRGSGLISFEEFDKHMQEGRLQFLESWLEWVSV